MNLAGPKLAAVVVATILVSGGALYYILHEEEQSYTLIDFDFQRAYDDLEYLAGDLPNRYSGTDNELQAARYIADSFNATGLTNVQIHEFPWTLYEPDPQPTLSVSYEQQQYIFGQPTGRNERNRSNLDHHDNFVILGFSGSLNQNDIEFVYVGNGDEANYSAAGDVTDKVVLVENDGTLSYSQIYLQALNYSAAVSLVFDQQRAWPIAKTSVGYDAADHLIPFPDAYPQYADDLIPHLMLDNATGYELKGWIAEAAENDDDYVEADIDVRVTIEERPVRVVTGDVAGDSEDFILLGGHMDTHYVGPGAVDNGVGTATVLELARQMANLTGLKKSLRFAAWGGEEIGLLGSYAYYKEFRSQLEDNLLFYLNFDMDHADLENGANRIPLEVNSKKYLGDIEAITEAFFEAEPGLASSYEVPITYRENAGPSDHRTFNLEGFPTATSYGSGSEQYHTRQDTLEHVNPESLQIAGRIEGSFALYMARR